MVAASIGNSDVVSLLLAHGANAEVWTSHSATLSDAVYAQHDM
jgi:hypothetical protein